jgi:hypothetical protein
MLDGLSGLFVKRPLMLGLSVMALAVLLAISMSKSFNHAVLHDDTARRFMAQLLSLTLAL